VTVVFANIFQPLIDVFEAVLKFFHDTIGLQWGLSIIALTVVVRAAILPLTLRQMKSMRRLQELSPKIKELQAKYKDDKQRQNEEMMKFYREHQVNPLGSCLPLLLQLPVFISLFYMLRTDLKKDICPPVTKYVAQVHPDGGLGAVSCTNGMNGQGPPTGAKISFTEWLHLPAQAHVPKHFDTGFLFIPDLTAKATGAVLITLIILYIGTQLASSLLMSVTADRTQRLIFMALPFFFVIFIINFPAGLLVYWITTNTWTIVQQYIVRRTVGPIRPPVQPDGSPAPSPFAQLKEALSGATGGSGSGGGGGSGSGSSGGGSKGNGAGAKASREKVAAGTKAKGGGGASTSAKPKPKRSGPPPASPRKKKKRSGRRR
jgi:YidC/Oxa1 family membrane protein insertase